MVDLYNTEENHGKSLNYDNGSIPKLSGSRTDTQLHTPGFNESMLGFHQATGSTSPKRAIIQAIDMAWLP